MKKDWVELWYKMANGLKSEYDNLISTDVFDFWTIYDLWLERIKQHNAKVNSKQK